MTTKMALSKGSRTSVNVKNKEELSKIVPQSGNQILHRRIVVPSHKMPSYVQSKCQNSKQCKSDYGYNP